MFKEEKDDKGESAKTEITWWAFLTYTKENADDSVGTWEKQNYQCV